MKTLGLTKLQLELMAVLWRKQSATIAEVHRAVGKRRGLALATVATLLRRLEKKGAVAHAVDGRQFVYRPLVSAEAVRRSRLTEVAETLLPADVPALISQLLMTDKIGADELEQVKKLIASRERTERKK
jgi:BlaI family transcriptional regulator, penicillinase repressor